MQLQAYTAISFWLCNASVGKCLQNAGCLALAKPCPELDAQRQCLLEKCGCGQWPPGENYLRWFQFSPLRRGSWA